MILTETPTLQAQITSLNNVILKMDYQILVLETCIRDSIDLKNAEYKVSAYNELVKERLEAGN